MSNEMSDAMRVEVIDAIQAAYVSWTKEYPDASREQFVNCLVQNTPDSTLASQRCFAAHVGPVLARHFPDRLAAIDKLLGQVTPRVYLHYEPDSGWVAEVGDCKILTTWGGKSRFATPEEALESLLPKPEPRPPVPSHVTVSMGPESRVTWASDGTFIIANPVTVDSEFPKE